MIRFLADESCDFTVVRGLRATGHDVVAISETARGAADLAVIAMLRVRPSHCPGMQLATEKTVRARRNRLPFTWLACR